MPQLIAQFVHVVGIVCCFIDGTVYSSNFLTNYQYLDVIFDTPHITNITVKNQMHIRFDTILQLGMAVPNYIKRDINASM
jgi:hypothetical protein